MKKIGIYSVLIYCLLLSCASSSSNFEKIKSKIYTNNFSFIVNNYEARKTFSVPSGTGRILTNSTPVTASDENGIIVHPDRLVINLPSVDPKGKLIDGKPITLTSENYTVARKDLENGNILLNFFINDNSDINLIKMEVGKGGSVDASVEGPRQNPLLYVGKILD